MGSASQPWRQSWVHRCKPIAFTFSFLRTCASFCQSNAPLLNVTYTSGFMLATLLICSVYISLVRIACSRCIDAALYGPLLQTSHAAFGHAREHWAVQLFWETKKSRTQVSLRLVCSRRMRVALPCGAARRRAVAAPLLVLLVNYVNVCGVMRCIAVCCCENDATWRASLQRTASGVNKPLQRSPSCTKHISM